VDINRRPGHQVVMLVRLSVVREASVVVTVLVHRLNLDHTVVVQVSLLVVLQAMNHHPSNHQLVAMVAVLMHQQLVAMLVVQAATKHHHSLVVDMEVTLASLLVEHPMERHLLKDNNGLLILKVSSKIQIHKSLDVQLLVVYKHTHKTFEFASFNHHLFHLQVHSLSEKCAHLNHLHLHLFVFVNKLHLFLHHLHSFFVKDHHNHQPHKLHKPLLVPYHHYLFHHDQSSLNAFHLFHHDHVISSLNVGFHMDLKLNDVPLFNVLLFLKDMLVHVMSLFNMNQFKFVLFVNSNDSVLLKLIHDLMFHNMVLHFLMLVHFLVKLVLLVL